MLLSGLFQIELGNYVTNTYLTWSLWTVIANYGMRIGSYNRFMCSIGSLHIVGTWRNMCLESRLHANCNGFAPTRLMSMVYYYILILLVNASYFAKVCFSFYACEILIWRLLNLLRQQPVASSKSVIENKQQQQQQHERVAANESASGSAAAGGKWDSCHLGDSLFASLMPFIR